jgi:hypothetical protein
MTKELTVRALRVLLNGNVLDSDVHYAIQLAFGTYGSEPNSTIPIYDAYVEYTRFRDLNLRLGQFFMPHDPLQLPSLRLRETNSVYVSGHLLKFQGLRPLREE